MTDHNGRLAMLQRIFDEGFSTGNGDVVDELCSPDLVEHQFSLAGRGSSAIDNIKAAIRDVHATVPDMSFTIEDSVEQGDQTLTDDLVIVDHEEPQGPARRPARSFGPFLVAHSASPVAAGRWSRIVVPAPGRLSISSSPRIIVERARMFASP